jgi:hypothetical protein
LYKPSRPERAFSRFQGIEPGRQWTGTWPFRRICSFASSNVRPKAPVVSTGRRYNFFHHSWSRPWQSSSLLSPSSRSQAPSSASRSSGSIGSTLVHQLRDSSPSLLISVSMPKLSRIASVSMPKLRIAS